MVNSKRNNQNSKAALLILLFAAFFTIAGCGNSNNIDNTKIQSDRNTISEQNPIESLTSKDNKTDGQKNTAENKNEITDTKSKDKLPSEGIEESSPNKTENNSPSANTGIKSNILKGKVICIDPGHGNPNSNINAEPIAPGSKVLKAGTDSGTQGVKTKIPEYKLNLCVALKLQAELLKSGSIVVLTRDNNNIDVSNSERAKIANSCKADLFIRVHADGSESSDTKGISVLYPGNEYIKDAEQLKKSKEAAAEMLSSVVHSTGAVSRGIVPRNDLTGFNWATVPEILIEMGFMTNPDEDVRLNQGDYQNKIVSGMIDGIVKYFLNN